MASLNPSLKRVRKSFGKVKQVLDLPGLIGVQLESYKRFLEEDLAPHERTDKGLHGVFKSVFPIEDYNKTATLEYDSYILEAPKYDVEECRIRGMIYAAPLKVVVRLIVWDVDEDTGTRNIRDIKEQEVYFGELPLMTSTGSFMINGVERVVVSQLHRSPGVFFGHDGGVGHASSKFLYNARIIPYRGSWLDFEFDNKNLIYVRIDRRRKMFVTILLKALDYTNEELLKMFYDSETIIFKKDGTYEKSLEFDILKGQRALQDIYHPKTKKILVKKNRKFNDKVIEELKSEKITSLPMEEEGVVQKYSMHDIINEKTGEILLECNSLLTKDKIELLKENGINEVKVLYIDMIHKGPYLRDTLEKDKVTSSEEAKIEVYKRLRPGDPPTVETAELLFKNLFFDPQRYDLSEVGRLKINKKFGLKIPLEHTTLTKEDMVEVVRYLVELKNGTGQVDDIDHLGNRRVKSVGEMIANQFRVGLLRMERAIKERMALQDIETLMPHDIINIKPVAAVIKEFFGSSQLSQFMDQTNPLSEITHKRRLSALGPGGLTRERAGFEVRDVHPTHYGRMCPVETPEGPNIGLISSLATYARINEFGFIETPYRKVVDGKITNELEFYTALDEDKVSIAQASSEIDKNGKFVEDFVLARKSGESALVTKDNIQLMDAATNQLVSVAAGLIPFLEHDDANRALMGSNMQRQAVPLLQTASPLVGTGLERVVARDSGVTVVARHDGHVEYVDAVKIVVKLTEDNVVDSPTGVDIYTLQKYQRSNQDTCYNQKPIVNVGEFVRKGDVIADGPATEMGELALGKNIMVGFMPWQGYNFEDSILLSEGLVKKDVFTSVHIMTYECIARDTKLGKEEVTRDIPNVGEEALRNLDSSGIVCVGSKVKPGDILVGKITPKGETQLSPEEKLLRAIFGEKAGDVKDTSLRVPPGVGGIIIGANIFSREIANKDARAKEIFHSEVEKLNRDKDTELDILRRGGKEKLKKYFVGKKLLSPLIGTGRKTILESGEKITDVIYGNLNYEQLEGIAVDQESEGKINEIISGANAQIEIVKSIFESKIEKLKNGDELPPGVIKIVKIYVAAKRKLSVGDKMAGRHGNKGVVSKILPEEDMPFMEDGRPLEMVLNPLGVPSRMNVGQILEIHLGLAAAAIGEQIQKYIDVNYSSDKLKTFLKSVYAGSNIDKLIDELDDDKLREFAGRLKYGVHFATPVFDGAKEDEIKKYLSMVDLPTTGQVTLFDGRTGELIEKNVTIGSMYMLKLHHLVEDKIHSRSIGPYSLVTQQPLGGKAQFGGQRLGEMEVWAIEAYGAAYALQEFLTVKSDDVQGRTKIYESIVKGEYTLEPGLPESFNVLMKELQGLGLDIRLLEKDKEDVLGAEAVKTENKPELTH